MWEWLKRITTRKVELAEKQLEIVANARELMDLMENWREYEGKPTEEIVTVLMFMGLGLLKAIYQGQIQTHLLVQQKSAYLN